MSAEGREGPSVTPATRECRGCKHLQTQEYVAMGERCSTNQCALLGVCVDRGTPKACPFGDGRKAVSS